MDEDQIIMGVKREIGILEYFLNHGWISEWKEDDVEFRKKAIETLLTAYEKEKEKNEELERKINHTYKKMCLECGNWFISKRSDAKHCQKCTKKVAHKRYREANRAKINEYSKLHMREYRAKKKLLKEE